MERNSSFYQLLSIRITHFESSWAHTTQLRTSLRIRYRNRWVCNEPAKPLNPGSKVNKIENTVLLINLFLCPLLDFNKLLFLRSDKIWAFLKSASLTWIGTHITQGTESALEEKKRGNLGPSKTPWIETSRTLHLDFLSTRVWITFRRSIVVKSLLTAESTTASSSRSSSALSWLETDSTYPIALPLGSAEDSRFNEDFGVYRLWIKLNFVIGNFWQEYWLIRILWIECMSRDNI